MTVKQEIITWIEGTEDEALLHLVKDWLEGLPINQEGRLMERLSTAQREKLKKSYAQAQDASQHISSEQVTERLNRWL
ncbi:MAG TPA: hypothetical protein DCR93_34095 [Cytophagales bacterium]|nr:hypothetical protein [Cytophagales bacterium]HAP64303.1 hypothetical protein [Cytophagales bacterium]